MAIVHDEELAPPPAVPAVPHPDSVPPTFCGVPLKQISLVSLALQNSLLALVMHYSRISTPPSRTYSAATAVLLTEIFKAVISLAIAFSRTPSTDESYPHRYLSRSRSLASEIFSSDCWKLSVPAILYVIQNNLQYVAASNLEPATFQVTYQMKILTTAAFSVLLLRRKLTPPQWLALFFLAVGVAMVQIQAAHPTSTSSHSMYGFHTMDTFKGFVAVTAACCTSGLAGVYFEMVLKNSQTDLWVRNVQLSVFSFLPALVPVIIEAQSSSSSSPISALSSIFHNFGPWAWATVSIQVLGGLLTALVIKYSDNILKGFATSLSIVISFLASVALFDFVLTFTFILGSLVVLIATWLYNQPQKRIFTFKTADNVLLSSVSRSTSTSATTQHFSFSPPHRSPASPVVYLKRVPSSTASLSSLASALPDEKTAYTR